MRVDAVESVGSVGKGKKGNWHMHGGRVYGMARGERGVSEILGLGNWSGGKGKVPVAVEHAHADGFPRLFGTHCDGD